MTEVWRRIGHQDIPQYAQDILTTIRKIDPQAVIAGGFLRDLEHHRPIKDLDIVVNQNTNVYDIAHALDYTGFVDVTDIDSNAQDTNFSFSAKLPLEGIPVPVELIGSRTGWGPVEKVKQNDFGICQIWYDGVSVQNTHKYDMDSLHKHMTLSRCNSELEWAAVQKHYLRLVKKYDWPMLISPEFLSLISRKFIFEIAGLDPSDKIPF